MEAYKEMDKQLDYEEEFVFLDLDDCVYSDIPPNAPFVISGLDTPSPILQIGDHLKLIGEYQETIGTCYIFSESDALSNEICPTDQSHTPHKQVKAVASLQKILKFKVSAEDRSKAEVANKITALALVTGYLTQQHSSVHWSFWNQVASGFRWIGN